MSDSSDYDSDSCVECPTTISEEEIEKLVQLFKKDVHRNYGLFVSLNNAKKQKNKGQNVSNKNCSIENQTNTNTNVQVYNYQHKQITVLPKYANEFFGRQNELKQVHDLLEQDKVCYIIAENGIGKTEFVKFYIENYHFKYLSIEMINARNEAKFQESITCICTKYNIKNVSNFFKDKNCLIVLDNYDQNINFRQFFQRSSKSTILILSSISLDESYYNLPNLSIDESLDILQSILQDNFNKYSERNWKKLCDFFENIPLALQISGSYVNEQMNKGKQLTVETCLDMYRQVNNTNKNHTAVVQTLKKIPEYVLDVLNTCVYLDDEFISTQVLIVHENIEFSNEKLNHVIDTLRNYRLIYIDVKENIKFIHIHDEIRNSLMKLQKNNNSNRKYFLSALTVLVHISILNIHHIIHILQYVKSFIYEFTEYILSNNRKAIFEVMIEYNFYDILDSVLTITPNKQIIMKQDNLMVLAANYEQIDVVKVLLKHGIDINIMYNTETVLHYASKKLLVDFVEVLLLNEANCNIENHNGNTCLHLAVMHSKNNEENCERITKMLIKSGANITAINFKGRTALYYALKNKSLNIALLLLNIVTTISITVIFSWTVYPDEEMTILKILKKLSKNSNLYETDKHGQNILMWAVKNRYIHIVRYLLTELNIDVNCIDSKGQTALHKIFDQNISNKKQAKSSVEIIKLLLDNFAQTDIKDFNGYTAYDYGQLRGNVKLCLYIQFINFELPKQTKKIYYYTQRYIEPPSRKPPPKPYFWETKSFNETLTSVGHAVRNCMHQVTIQPSGFSAIGNVARECMHQMIAQPPTYSSIAGPSYLQILGPP